MEGVRCGKDIMEKIIGSCSICGGDVWRYIGPWYAIVPPPPPKCISCGATMRAGVIAMTPKPVNFNDHHAG